MLQWWKRRKRRTRLALIAAAVLGIAVGGAWAWLTWDLPPVSGLEDGLALPSTRIFDRHGTLLYEILADGDTGGRNTTIPLESIPAHCVAAVISTEDANFYTHPGVDLIGIVRAAVINVTGGEIAAGGSTITQQVARITLLDAGERTERTLRRKLREALLAFQLSAVYSKDEILTLYLNQAYFGGLAYGIEAAARGYFGKSAAELSLAECALLAGLLQSPATYDPLTDLPAAEARQEVVLDLMVASGRITAEQAETAKAEALQFASALFPIQAPHFVMAVIRQLEARYPDGLTRDGLDVITTLDLNWQNTAEQIVRAQLDTLNSAAFNRQPANAHNAAVVAIDPQTGEVLTMLGSPDYFDERIDGAVNAAYALRQPGSTLKPFTYAAALDPAQPNAWTAATMILDVETPFVTRRLESYTPSNYGLVEHGPVLVREALASSLNIPAVITLDHIGIPAMVELATDAGLTTLAGNTQVDLSITLGGGEIRLIDLTAAYSIFANGGLRVDPVLIREVRTRAGEVLLTPESMSAPRLRVIDERLSWLITDILSDDEARIAGFGRGSALNIGRPAAAKTGTTTDTRDNWIVGYTPEVVVGVWVGNADNAPMVEVTGITGAAPVWNLFMRQVLRGVPESSFARPDGLERVTVCALSGLLPTEACPNTRNEWFISGTAPTSEDNIFQRLVIDRRTGGLADDTTPPDDQITQVFAVLPQEARDWAIRNGYPPPPSGSRALIPDSDAGLRLLEPDPYTVFQIAQSIPLDSQRLRLTVGAPADTIRVTYVLDGQTIGSADAPSWVVWWTLEIGDHELIAQAELSDGTTITSAAVPFSVVEDAPLQSYTDGG